MPPRPKSDKELLDFILDRAAVVRKSYDAMYGRWRTNLKYYYGKPESYDPKLPYFNSIRRNLKTQLAHKLAARPTIFVRAFSAEMDALADAVDVVMAEQQWRMRAQGVIPRVLETASVVGTAFLGLFWDEPYGMGKPGRIRAEFVNPAEIVLDPRATRIEEAEWLIRERFITAKEIRTRFPKMASEIPDLKQEAVEAIDFSREMMEIAGQPAFQSGKKTEEPEKLYQYIEAWTDKGRTLTELVGGRFVVKDSAQDFPMDSPYRHGRIPYVPFYGDEDPLSFWGYGEAEVAHDAEEQSNMQRRRQVLAFEAAQKAMKLYYPGTVVGMIPEALTALSFDAIPVEDVTQIPKITDLSGVVQYLELLQNFVGQMDQEADQATGQSEAQRGGRMKGVYSGRHQAQLLAQSEQTFGPKLESMNYSMRLVGEQLLFLTEQFYTLEGQQPSFSDGKRKITVRDEDGKIMLPELEDPEAFPAIETRFQIVVQPQDEKPMSRQAQVQDLLQLLQLQSVDIETAIKAMRLPNGDDMLDLMSKKNAAGMPPLQPMPLELVEIFLEKAMEDAKLAAAQQENERAKMWMQVEAERQMLEQGINPDQQGQQQGFAGPQGGVPVAGPGMMQGGGGMPAEAAQMMEEQQNMSIGQPPV